MATQVIAQIDNAKVVGAPYGDPADVENDTSLAPQGTVNVHIQPTQGVSGFLTIEPTATAVIAALTNGNCTVWVGQGAGTTSVVVPS
jgi:hypothetical protein